MKLWIDDERPMPSQFTDHALNPEQAIEILRSAQATKQEFELASFDHDLGWTETMEDITSRPILRWIIDNNYWPHQMRFHTANFVGHKWLRLLARDEAPETTFVDLRDPWNDADAYVEFGLRR